VVYIERLPDTDAKYHFDCGFHVTSFYGIDYRFTTAKGYFSEQLLLSNKSMASILFWSTSTFISQSWTASTSDSGGSFQFLGSRRSSRGTARM
jgi:hypothetical protein